MIIPKKLIKLAKKWQNLAASKRKRISLPRTSRIAEAENCSTSSMAEKGHFVIYTADQKRFMIPLKYLKNNIMQELFNITEDEFGLPGAGAITLPCDAVFMEYVISLIQRRAAKDVEQALLISLGTGSCLWSSYHNQEQNTQRLLVCAF